MFIFQSPADSSLAVEVGTAVGGQVTFYVLAGLGLVTKLITSVVGKLLPKWTALPDLVKAIVALAFAQLVVFVNAKFGWAVSSDITLIGTSLTGIVTWLAAMGWHRLAKFLPKGATTP